MKIRHKISIVAISGIFLIALFSIILLRASFTNYAEKAENSVVGQDFYRAMAIIHHEESSLEGAVKDWAYWDDTYRYIEDANTNYVVENLHNNTFISLNLNYMGFFDLKGNTVFAKTYGIEPSNENLFKDELFKSLQMGTNYKSLLSSPIPVTGLLMISGKPALISISPVTTSDRRSTTDGVIVFCKLIDQKLLDYIKEVLKVNIKFDTPQDPEVYEISNQDNLRIPFGDNILYIEKTVDFVKSFAQVNNVYNNSKIFMVLDAGRPMYLDGLAIIKYSSFAFIITFLIIASLCLLVLEFSVFRRIEKLDRFMNNVKTKKIMSERISLPGNDEISNLAVSSNNMLKEIDSYYEEIKINEERFKLIMEATSDGYFDTDLQLNKFYVNPDWLRYLGYENCDGYLDYNQSLNLIHPEDRNQYHAALNDCLNGKTQKLIVEYRVRRKSGEWLWLHVRGKIVEYDELKN
ncbi:MAG: CHASE4 domain-containing protein, partial [Bacillota bacterium]|nr:CHASE4 domain-containing protein [Bacillota bacterium]